jgi:hypothetical protein
MIKKYRKKGPDILWDKEPPKMPLNSFLVEHILLGMRPILVVSLPSETSLEKTKFWFASVYLLKIAPGLEMGLCPLLLSDLLFQNFGTHLDCNQCVLWNLFLLIFTNVYHLCTLIAKTWSGFALCSHPHSWYQAFFSWTCYQFVMDKCLSYAFC